MRKFIFVLMDPEAKKEKTSSESNVLVTCHSSADGDALGSLAGASVIWPGCTLLWPGTMGK